MSRTLPQIRQWFRVRALLLPALRLALSLGLLALVLLRLDPTALAQAFAAPHPGWLLLALGLSLPQIVLSAWRWRLTAHQLGVPLGLRHAVAEYYLATFLNQMLPGGVMGDAGRAWRHARSEAAAGQRAGAWHAVLIERASGQLALLLVALLTLAWSPALQAVPLRLLGLDGAAAAQAAGATFWRLLAAALLVGLAGWRWPTVIGRLGRAVQHALLAREVFARQLIASLLIVASYLAVYLCCMRMVGITTPFGEVMPLVPWVLLAMAIPLSIAGWGIREGAAALVWSLAGLNAAEGVAISVSYGLVVLLSSLPGALLLLPRRR